MMNRRSFRSYQPMNMVYKSPQFGTELWLGDYYAATDNNLLKAKGVKAGILFIFIQVFHLFYTIH